MLSRLLIAGLACLGTNATPLRDSAKSSSIPLKDRSALITEKAPLHFLLPRNPPDHAPHDHIHLELHVTKHLFFGQEHPERPMKWDSRYASAHTTFKHPAVVLDHSSHAITSLKGDVMAVQFSEWSPYATARANWTEAGLPFLLVTTVGSKDDHFVYYLTNWVECVDETLACNLGVEASELEHIGDEFTLEFGHWSDLTKRDVSPPLVPEAPPIPGSIPETPSDPLTPESSFDASIDEQAGFYEWTPETFAADLRNFADDITDFDYDHYNSNAIDIGGIYNMDGSTKGDYILEATESDFDLMRFRKRVIDIQKRGIVDVVRGKLVAVGQAVVNGVKGAVVDTGNKIAEAFKNVKDRIFAAIDEVKSWVDGTPRTWETAETYAYPNSSDKRWITQNNFKRADGKFYNALSLFEEKKGGATINAYCLDCQASAGIRIRGTIGYKWGEGLKHGSVGIHGNFKATMILGVAAQCRYQYRYEKRIFDGGIPGLSVPPFFTLGPMATADLGANFDLNIAGNMLAGATATLDNIDAVIDIVDNDKSKKPVFKPKIEPIAAVSGALAAGFSMSMQIGLALGLSIAKGAARADVSLISEPGVGIKVTGGAAASLTGGVNTATDGCQGLKLEYELQHSLYAQAKARLVFKDFDSKKWKLIDDFRQKVGGTCIGKNVKRQIDNGTAVDEANEAGFDLYEDYSVAVTELEPADGSDLFLTEFTDDQYKVPSAVEAFIDTPPTLESDIATLNANVSNTAFNYSAVAETSLDWMLASTTDGNLALQPAESDLDPNNLFAYYENVLIGDAFGRVLVYYDGEMARYNASRIRMVLPERIPKTSKSIGLWPIDIGPTPNAAPNMTTDLLVAIDSSTNPYYPVLCNYVGGLFASKMFIVSDPVSGIAALTSSGTDTTLTGAPIQKCDLLGLLTIEM
ncbi:hypothetical protein EK21DRAFT_87870 [Setomelanomma holmii]|uniref:Uncharacterized protein n=1 Tax=Setomelanomma holmii TaxID=210430 RepID=A0A9P4LNU6_9PLEO|nr:hypothetical protein EK21DRAFT_87870 [Setomelanomma holmii]